MPSPLRNLVSLLLAMACIALLAATAALTVKTRAVEPEALAKQVEAMETRPVEPDALAKQMEAVTKDVTQGALRVVKKDGEVVECPLKHTDVKATISGFIARVKVTQTFLNPLDEKIEAVYVFPLPHKSAVDDMTMVIGDRRIVGLIKRRTEARQIYEQALAQGMTAALLEQERPNIFTQSVGNISPGQEVKIEISYVDVLEYDMGVYEFHFPMVVGPRYIPGSSTSTIPPVPTELKGKVGELDKTKVPEGPNKPKGTGWAPDTDRVPDASRITPPVLKPDYRNGHDISLEVALDAGVPIQDLKITSHEAAVRRIGKSQAAVQLSPADSIPNKAFVLRYAVVGKAPAMAVLTHTDAKGAGYLMLMVQPADDERLRQAPPREIVFMVDVSGSMSGEPTAKNIEAMSQFLKLCKPDDTVQVITFASDSRKLFEKPVPVTPENITKALNFTEGLRGGGGTEMLKGIRMALGDPLDEKRVRIIIMLTDGFIGNEAEIIAEVGRRAGDRIRFWCIGIGSDPNRFLLDGVARQGGGMSKVLGLRDDTVPLVQEVMTRIHTAQLSDIHIDWNGLKIFETYPAKIPGLWAGQPVVLFGMYQGSGRATISINGNVEGKDTSWPLEVTLPEREDRNEVLAKVWARNKIEDLMQQTFYEGSPEVEDAVTAIALEYRLMSQYTSFVAVDEKDLGKLREPARPPRRMLVPVPIPEGTRFEGFFGEADEAAKPAAPQVAHLWAGMPAERAAVASPKALSVGRFVSRSAVTSASLSYGRGKYKPGPSSIVRTYTDNPFPDAASNNLARLDVIGAGGGGNPIGGFEGLDADYSVTGQAIASMASAQQERLKQVLNEAADLQKKGDLLAARAKYAAAYLLATSYGQPGEPVSLKALEGINKTTEGLVKAWTKELPGLAKPLDLVLRDQSVADALAAVAKGSGLRITLLAGSVEDAAALLRQRDARITYLDLRGATAAQALDWILTPLRMAWWVDKDVILAGTARRRWSEVDGLLAAFLGQCDDLTPLEYADVLSKVTAKKAEGDLFARFKTEIARLRDPTINSMALTPQDMLLWKELTKGMRFLGQRHLLDSEAFMMLTDPAVPGRLFPSGLDWLAANGSERAARMLAAGPDATMKGYAESAKAARALFDRAKQAPSPTVYVEFLKVTETLVRPPDPAAAAFTRTEAWQDKSVTTALGAWAAMRHTWQLHVKDSASAGCIGPEQVLPGYVEPNPAFFAGMRCLVQKSAQVLKPFDREARTLSNGPATRLEKLDALLARLETMVRKELSGEPFSAEEIKLLDDYGFTLQTLQGFYYNFPADKAGPWMAQVADVHSETAVIRKCLEVATGGAMPIYVAVEHKGRYQLLIGGVISYYEFLQPISNRLTDEEWQRVWDNGRMPSPPQWTSSYLATHDVASLMKRMSAGEAVPDLLWMDDPALTAALEKEVQPGGGLVGKPNYGWALEVATRKLGRKMVPLLLDVLKNGKTTIEVDERLKGGEEGYEYYRSPAEMAARSLLMLDSQLDAAALQELSAIEDATRAEQVVDAAGWSRSEAARKVLVDVVIRNPHVKVKGEALKFLKNCDWMEGVPLLTAYWPKAPDEVRVLLLETIDNLLGDPPDSIFGRGRHIAILRIPSRPQSYPRPSNEHYEAGV
ncbi:MAG TPA: DUF3160 domain-containing protein [Phycisphaerae bacterium]|nr:DUF3160 domain-containing protein [Phycisphaerae bacterium]